MKKPVQDIKRISTVTEMHRLLELSGPDHPLISVVHHRDARDKDFGEERYSSELYHISMKNGVLCSMGYGRSSYDYQDGSIVFIAPGQVISAGKVEYAGDTTGWTLAFHPDLIRKSELGRKMDGYSFFLYEVNEALHLSEKEVENLAQIVGKIEEESRLNIDRHSQTLIISNLELLLNYCTRYYDRQFYTRTNLNRDHIARFEALLKEYYESDRPLEMGIPTVKYCGRELGMSPPYLSDLLKQETGKNAQEHIHLFLVERAKALILNRDNSITQIAYDLGFEYPQHFSRLFKAKTGMSPREFRAS